MAENEEVKDPISQEDLVAAEEFKNEANEYFKKQNYIIAIEFYSKAIEKNPNNAVYYANRSISNLRLENFGYALSDATKAIEIDRSYTKAYYRRAAAYMSLSKYKLALKDFEYVTKVRPNDQDAKMKYNECAKIVKKIAFEKAIAVDKVVVNVADSINLDAMKLMEHFKDQKKLHRKFAYKILIDAKAYLQTLPSMVDIKVPYDEKFTVCGDIHGQYYDLLNVFKLNGLPSESNPYLFNGDFVDRGSFSVECIFTLVYGFRGEVTAKYSSQMADLFTEVYHWLPLAHCINSRVLVMHGIMCDLLWSDPQPMMGRSQSKRGVGCQFGPDITADFLEKNNLDYIIRSHEVKNQGYEIAHNGKCITVFSAPNYCDAMGNLGAFITMNGKDLKPNFTTYEAVPHPNVKAMAYAHSMLSMFC
ncbi:unnamed protein product [Leptidea sinapis]|uniref:protein-serine/threonine phosphatase n=1 Tax=Leptidea sinapis TaxID=189913 RepID=A0A5E4QUU3_9NEOP|nr:unnamed protein product [Leptidea sinapis]